MNPEDSFEKGFTDSWNVKNRKINTTPMTIMSAGIASGLF